MPSLNSLPARFGSALAGGDHTLEIAVAELGAEEAFLLVFFSSDAHH